MGWGGAGHQGVGLLGLKQKAAIRGGAGTGYQKAIGKCAREALPAATPGEGRGATHRHGGLCRPLAEKMEGCLFIHSFTASECCYAGGSALLCSYKASLDSVAAWLRHSTEAARVWAAPSGVYRLD